MAFGGLRDKEPPDFRRVVVRISRAFEDGHQFGETVRLLQKSGHPERFGLLGQGVYRIAAGHEDPDVGEARPDLIQH